MSSPFYRGGEKVYRRLCQAALKGEDRIQEALTFKVSPMLGVVFGEQIVHCARL